MNLRPRIVIQMFHKGSGTVWVEPKGIRELSLSYPGAGFLTDDVLRNYSLLKL